MPTQIEIIYKQPTQIKCATCYATLEIINTMIIDSVHYIYIDHNECVCGKDEEYYGEEL